MTPRSALLAISLSLATAQAQALTLSLTPSTSAVTTGDNFSLDLIAADLGDGIAPSIGGFDIDLAFDPSLLGFTGYVLDDHLGDFALFEAEDFSGGDLGGGMANLLVLSYLPAVDLDAIQSDNFRLARLDFVALSAGSGTVSFDHIDVSDAAANALVPTATTAAQVQVTDTAVVPAPGVLSLMVLAGLLAFPRLRRA